ncbi:MAG: CHAD domain-containing protein [Acidobacteriota bacterium]
MRKSPHDADAIHDLRVAVRRFRQCLRTFEPYFHARVTKRLHDMLANADGLLRGGPQSRRRIATAAGIRRRRPPLDQQLAKQRFDKEQAHGSRTDALARLESQISSSAIPRRTRFENCPSSRKNGFTLAISRPKASPTRSCMSFRILSKHLRYTLELFSDIYGESAKPYMQQLRELQDQLGAINDCVTAARLVRTHRQAASVLKKLLAVRERKFRAAWKKTAKQRDLGSNGWERQNMEIYILRHGEAEPRETGVDDGNRALIAKGKRDVRDVLKAARRAKVAPELILTSPLRRAHVNCRSGHGDLTGLSIDSH